MSEPADEPPLVTRPPEPPEAPAAPPRRPRPGFWEAALWCAAFLSVQLCAAMVVVLAVLGAYMIAAPQPGQFLDDQLSGAKQAVKPKPADGPSPMPFEIGQAIAYGMLAAQVASLGVVALVLPRRIGPDWKRELGVRRPNGLHALLVVLLVPGFMILSVVIQEAFQLATGMRQWVDTRWLNGVFKTFPVPLTVLAVALGPGVVEELWWRGFLGRGLSARYGLLAGVSLTSVLFAVTHVDPSQLLVIALMGAYLHFVYVATRSIWAPVLLHALNNGVTILLVLALKTDEMDQNRHVPFVVTLAALSLMIFATVALWTGRATILPIRGEKAGWEDTGWKPEYPGVSAPPPEADVRLGYEVASPVAVMFTFASFAAVMYLGYRYLV